MKYAPSVPIVALLALCAGAFLPLEDAKAAADPGPSPSANAGAAAAPTAAAETVPFTVDTKQFVFAPTPLTVPAGSTVVFKNSDSVAHTVTAADGSFDSKNMDEGQTWSHTFAKAGTYDYVCAYHAFMKGRIIVK